MTIKDSKYQMLWAGAWRPVTNMFEGGLQTSNPLRATRAVLYLEPERWEAVSVNPGDIVRRDHRAPHPRDWDVI